MKPSLHCRSSVRKYGGVVEDYLPVHEWVDASKEHVADVRHRILRHNSMGPYWAVEVFGPFLVNADGRSVDVRQLVEDHILEDLGHIPSLASLIEELVPLDQAAKQLGFRTRPYERRHHD